MAAEGTNQALPVSVSMSSSQSYQERLLLPLSQGATALRGVLLYPQSYAVGMSSLATHTLYTALNDETMRWERAFFNPAKDVARQRQLCSLESRTPLRDFDVVAVTSSYELDWPAIPVALQAGGVPPLRVDRRQSPLVIAGGPALSAAPLALSALYDAACCGEIEPVLPSLKAALLAPTPGATLELLAATPGFFVPALHTDLQVGMVKRQCAADLDQFETASVILSPQAEFADRFLVEMGRGCGRSCSFCLARQLYKPLRWRSLDRIVETVRRGLQWTNDLGLVAAAVSDYPELEALCEALQGLSPNLRVSTSSVRMETATPSFLKMLANGGQKTVTFAPEAATASLRRAIGKLLPEETLLAAVQRAAEAGLTRVRLYFMVGLPGESADDRAAIADLARRLTREFPTLHFRFNVGAFSPRPHTPFERQGLPPLRDLRRWLSQVQKSLRGLPRVEAATDSARWAAMQAALSRADERLGRALADRPPLGFADLVTSLATVGLDFEALVAEVPPEQWQPWKIVDPTCPP